jgi:hypothetical protein
MLRRFFYRGRHRGEYVEEPGWQRQPAGITYDPETGGLIYNGIITLSGPASPTESAVLTIAPSGGLCNIPALGEPPPVLTFEDIERLYTEAGDRYEDGIRDIVRDELHATPIYTGVKYGG